MHPCIWVCEHKRKAGAMLMLRKYRCYCAVRICTQRSRRLLSRLQGLHDYARLRHLEGDNDAVARTNEAGKEGVKTFYFMDMYLNCNLGCMLQQLFPV
jgi:hypothetical protein